MSEECVSHSRDDLGDVFDRRVSEFGETHIE